jgi:hypothetical protein
VAFFLLATGYWPPASYRGGTITALESHEHLLLAAGKGLSLTLPLYNYGGKYEKNTFNHISIVCGYAGSQSGGGKNSKRHQPPGGKKR